MTDRVDALAIAQMYRAQSNSGRGTVDRLAWDGLTFASYVGSIVAATPAIMRASTAAVALDLSQVAGKVHSRKQLIDEVTRFYDGTCAATLANAYREALHLWKLFSTSCKVHADGGPDRSADVPDLAGGRAAVPLCQVD